MSNTGRLLAIGDVHGHLSALDHVLALANPGADDVVVFLGDYIDRGPRSSGVIERVRQVSELVPTVTLRGNHEQYMLDARTDREQFKQWFANGGRTTVASYGVDPDHAWRNEWYRYIPDAHWDFLERTQLFFETPHCIFVHGGLEHHLPPEAQSPKTLLWTRLTEISPHFTGKRVIVGHTPQMSGEIAILPHVVGIDTGLGYPGGRLSCLNLTEGKVYQADGSGWYRKVQLVPSAARPVRVTAAGRRVRVPALPGPLIPVSAARLLPGRKGARRP